MKSKEKINLDMVINEIAENVPSNLSTLEKIRYVYITVGKIVSKHTDFFLSVNKKLKDNNLSYEELKRIYEDEKDDPLSDDNTQVICKSAAIILKKVFDKLEIDSKLVKTLNSTEVQNPNNPNEILNIYHWFLAVSDEDNTYFLTLAADLPFIQNGFSTEHFATNIPYINAEGERNYDGEKIQNKSLNSEDIRTLDMNIGYLEEWHEEHGNINWRYSNYAFELIRRKMTGNSLYLELEEEKTDFYKSLIEFTGEFGRTINLLDTPLEELTTKDWDILKKNLCSRVEAKLKEKLKINIPFSKNETDYQQWLKDMAQLLSIKLAQTYGDNYQDLFTITENFNFTNWTKAIKKEWKKQRIELPSEFEFLVQTNSLVTKIDNYINAKSQDEKDGNAKYFAKLFHQVAFHFLDDECIEKKQTLADGYLSSNYIARKLLTIFPEIFSCGIKTPFNAQSYSEQIVMIKRLLPEIFPELNYNNCHQMINYDGKYRPVDNRIQIYPLRHKETGEYSILFNVVGSIKEEEDYYYFYNLQTNEFKEDQYTNYQLKSSKYQVASNRLASKLQEIEDIEQPIKK